MVRVYNISKMGKYSGIQATIFFLNRNQDSTHNSNYKKEIVSEINDIEEITEGTFLINFKLIKKYQRKYPRLLDKYKEGAYQTGYFCGGCNIYLSLITCEDNISIPSILQSYVLHWYHTYLLHTLMDIMEAVIFQHLY